MTKTEIVAFRLNIQEKEQLLEHIEKLDMTVSQFMRQLVREYLKETNDK